MTKNKYYNAHKKSKKEDLISLGKHFLSSGFPNYGDFADHFAEMYGRTPKALRIMLGKTFDKKPVRGTRTRRKLNVVVEQPAVEATVDIKQEPQSEPKVDVQQTETAADVMTITGDITVVLTSRLLHNHTIKANTVVFEDNQIVIKL